MQTTDAEQLIILDKEQGRRRALEQAGQRLHSAEAFADWWYAQEGNALEFDDGVLVEDEVQAACDSALASYRAEHSDLTAKMLEHNRKVVFKENKLQSRRLRASSIRKAVRDLIVSTWLGLGEDEKGLEVIKGVRELLKEHTSGSNTRFEIGNDKYAYVDRQYAPSDGEAFTYVVQRERDGRYFKYDFCYFPDSCGESYDVDDTLTQVVPVAGEKLDFFNKQ